MCWCQDLGEEASTGLTLRAALNHPLLLPSHSQSLCFTPTLAHRCTNSHARTHTPTFSLAVLCLLCFTYLKSLLFVCWWVPVADIYRASAPLEMSPLGRAEPRTPLPMSPWMSKDGSLNPELLPTPGIWCEAPAMREAAMLMETPPESMAGGRL